MKKEGITTEYKREYSDNIKKSIIAFANTDGGTITLGIDDDGSIVGVANPDMLITQITNVMRDSIKPDISLFVKCEHKEIDNKDLVEITVQKGTASPYYLASKGIRPEGVFIRHGASSIPASETAILNMIRTSSKDSYEENRSLNQELSFTSLTYEFAQADLPLEQAQFKTLHLIGRDGLYTNLALLLSEQCVHSIKLAVFQGVTKEIFRDRQEFTGSLFRQLIECHSFIDRYNKTHSSFDGLKRIDTRDYPTTAIREALLNCIVHREYALTGSILVSIFDDRIEFVTLGGLVKGISKDDILLGVSLLRNTHLANIFYRLKLIEAYGTGIPKIMENYENRDIPTPKIEVTDNAFKITLYNTNYHHSSAISHHTKAEQAFITKAVLTTKEEQVMRFITSKESITRKDLEQSFDISQSMAIKYLHQLQVKGYIEKRGKGKGLEYRVAGGI